MRLGCEYIDARWSTNISSCHTHIGRFALVLRPHVPPLDRPPYLLITPEVHIFHSGACHHSPFCSWHGVFKSRGGRTPTNLDVVVFRTHSLQLTARRAFARLARRAFGHRSVQKQRLTPYDQAKQQKGADKKGRTGVFSCGCACDRLQSVAIAAQVVVRRNESSRVRLSFALPCLDNIQR